MKKVLIISISREEQQGMEDALASASGVLPPGFGEIQFETTASFGQEPSWWAQNAPDCLIICLPSDDLMQGYFLTKLRADVPRNLPVIILSSYISASLMGLSQIFGRVRMLKSPVEGRAILKIIGEISSQWPTGLQQAHPRYLTEQPVVVSSGMESWQLLGTMKNLSLSGAYIEAPEISLPFKSGEVLKVSIQAGSPPKAYVFDAKVVWMKPLENVTGNGFGVTFVDKEYVYNQLLKGF